MERTFHMLLYRAFHAQRSVLRPYLGELGLGTGQPKLLAYLSRNGASSQRQLADYFEIDPAAVCRMLDSLQKGGFITRQTSSQDKRRDRIELTPLGQQTHEAWERRCREMEEQMLRDFSPQERAQFADFLGRAYHNLKAGKEGRS